MLSKIEFFNMRNDCCTGSLVLEKDRIDEFMMRAKLSIEQSGSHNIKAIVGKRIFFGNYSDLLDSWPIDGS